MKKLFLFFILTCITSCIFSQTLFTYGNNAVSKDEFLRAYNKNKTSVTDKEKAFREYLDLYIKFKLKVKVAMDMHLDTLASLANDLQNFRTQIEGGYLNDESRVNILLQEAFDRSQKDIHVAYFFFPIKDFKDSISVEKQYKLLKPSWTDIGFITVFSLPYNFENTVYGLKSGEESKPVRAKNGFYILKNIEERKAAGKIKAAQILIAVPEGANDEQKNSAARIADSVYKLLHTGTDFGEMAKIISNDKMTYLSGGLMPEFGVGKYTPAFENKVFALQKDGDITAPFQTEFGYHIVKRISHTDIPHDKNDAGSLYALKQQVQQDARIASAKEKFVTDILKRLNYKKNNLVNEDYLWKISDSFVVANKKIPFANLNDKTILFSLGTIPVKVAAWLAFIRDFKTNLAVYKGESDKDLMSKFVSINALDNYRKRLQDFNPDFKYQLQEFKDGNMLFEVMERNVWTKASNDTDGLKNYYNQHKTKYTWNESADAVLFSCANEKMAKDAAEQIKNGKTWEQAAEGNAQIQADSGRYELNQLTVKPNTNLTLGMVTEPLINPSDGTASFVKILKLYPANQQRSFEEARGMVINDYQTFLEEKWIQQLKKRYPVKVDEKVFKSML